jgi:outer membrane protein assembly factor BamE (lipoprotein component of BamABCDE complex)
MTSLRIFLVGAFTAGALVMTGCASKQDAPQKSNLTYGTVKQSIVKGQTSQAEVVQLLGSPNIVTKNKNNEEVWTYSKQSYDSKSGTFGGGLIFIGGSKAFSSSASSSFDLIITFTDDDIVKDYSVVQSQF